MQPWVFILVPLLAILIAAVAVRRLGGQRRHDWRFRSGTARIAFAFISLALILHVAVLVRNGSPLWHDRSLYLLILVAGLVGFDWWNAHRKILASEASGGRRRAAPSFLWQGALILLPVSVMTVIALISLRQDRLLAEQDAKESGAALVRQLVAAIGNGLGTDLRAYRDARFEFRALEEHSLSLTAITGHSAALREHVADWQQSHPDVDLARMPLSDAAISESPDDCHPRSYSPAPEPAAWLNALSAEQRQLWNAAQQAEFASNDISSARALLEGLLQTDPPAGAAANAEALFLRWEMQRHDDFDAAALITRTQGKLSPHLTESGLPLGQIVYYEALRKQPDGAGVSGDLLGRIARSISQQPSVFSPLLISEIERVAGPRSGAATLRSWWNAQERTRTVLAGLRNIPAMETRSNIFHWTPDGEFLVAIEYEPPDGTNAAASTPLLLFPRVVVERALRTSIGATGITVPAYATCLLRIGGRDWDVRQSAFVESTTASDQPLMADAPGAVGYLPFSSLPYPFHLRILLASPDVLYARQRQRTFLFGGLVVASAVASLIGLVAAYRAFRRQLLLNETKSNFVSSVSHELRAPIASVRLMAESLERGRIEEPAKRNEYFKFIVQECRRLSSLIENVLDFSRIEQGRKQYEFEPTDINALARETVKLMEPYAAEKGVALKLETSNIEHRTPNIELNVDGRAIQQALINLIDNAIKHSPKGETVQVGLDLPAMTDHGPQTTDQEARHTPASRLAPPATLNSQLSTLNLSVTDRGPGIPAAEHEKIFERFYRRGSELRRETPGVGIGLSIVKHIVEAHGGRVEVRSAVGQGSCFVIQLPLNQSKVRNLKAE